LLLSLTKSERKRHNTSTTGSIGAAVAVSKLLSMSALQTTHAIGIAATQVTGLREMWGSHTKSFHIGRAAQNGLLAALLAQGGFTSTEHVLEAKRGWVNVVAVTKKDREADLSKFLGMGNADHNLGLAGSGGATGQWEILFNSFKPFPCGIVIHPIIDACIQLRSELIANGQDASDVASVFMRVHPLTIELTGKKTPKDGLEAKFSVYHGAAIGLLFGKGSLTQYQDNVAQDPVVIDLRDRCEAVADTGIAPDEVRVTLKMKNGKTIEKHLIHAVGSVDKPLTKEQLTEKFKDQTAKFLGDKLDSASQALWDIEDAADISQVLRSM
jgi:aconitate decarboxylase